MSVSLRMTDGGGDTQPPTSGPMNDVQRGAEGEHLQEAAQPTESFGMSVVSPLAPRIDGHGHGQGDEVEQDVEEREQEGDRASEGHSGGGDYVPAAAQIRAQIRAAREGEFRAALGGGLGEEDPLADDPEYGEAESAGGGGHDVAGESGQGQRGRAVGLVCVDRGRPPDASDSEEEKGGDGDEDSSVVSGMDAWGAGDRKQKRGERLVWERWSPDGFCQNHIQLVYVGCPL